VERTSTPNRESIWWSNDDRVSISPRAVQYVEVPGLHEDAPHDDLVALVKTFQYEDWTELGLADADSAEHRHGVHG
jgi:hypothetical protein